MNNLIRERKGMLILSLLVILLPMGLGLFLWNQLPDQVPIHFGLNGQADNYAGKAFVVFGLPLLMAALQVLLLVVTMADPKGKNIAAKPFGLLLWICPLVSLFCGTMTYAKALALPVDINLVGGLFLGLVILALTFLRLPALQFVVILVLVLIPTAASFLYARRRETK